MKSKFKLLKAATLALLMTASPMMAQNTWAADNAIMNVELAEGEYRRVGVLKQIEMTNFPWFIFDFESESIGTTGKYSLSLEAANLTEDQFVAMLNQKIAFIVKPVIGGSIADVVLNEKRLYNFGTLAPDLEIQEGTLHRAKIDIRGNSIDTAALEFNNGFVLTFTGAQVERLEPAFGKQVTVYFEEWTDDNITQISLISE